LPSVVVLLNIITAVLILVLVVRIILANVVLVVGRERLHPALNAVDEFLVDVTEPILAPVRQVLPKGLPIDFSPLVAIIVIDLIARFLTFALLRVM